MVILATTVKSSTINAASRGTMPTIDSWFKDLAPDFKSGLSSILKAAANPNWDMEELKNKEPEEYDIYYLELPDFDELSRVVKGKDKTTSANKRGLEKVRRDLRKVYPDWFNGDKFIGPSEDEDAYLDDLEDLRTDGRYDFLFDDKGEFHPERLSLGDDIDDIDDEDNPLGDESDMVSKDEIDELEKIDRIDRPIQSRVKIFYLGYTDSDKEFYVDIDRPMVIKGLENWKNLIGKAIEPIENDEYFYQVMEVNLNGEDHKVGNYNADVVNYYNNAKMIYDVVSDWGDWVVSPNEKTLVDVRYPAGKVKQHFEVNDDKIDEAIQGFVDDYIE